MTSSHRLSYAHSSRRSRYSLAQLEQLETRRLLSAAIEPIDGVGNNVANPTWGSAGIDLLRLTAAAYADGVDSPSLPADQSARAISNILNNQADPNNPAADIATIDQNSLSDFGYSFGQFIDHDLDLTPDGGAEFDIPVTASDPIGPNNLPFTRSQTDPATGTSASNPAQQVTTVTSYLDLSQVYGSNQPIADALRTHTGGLMKNSPGNMLPYDNTTYFTQAQITALNMANDSGAVSTDKLFATGDRRGNENIELTTLQTLFLRNHNRIATQLAKDHPTWTDEQLYQEARKLNIAEYQQIVYNQWLPALLGNGALKAYRGYRSNVNATISTEFSTVAFRFGHSLLSAVIERHYNDASDMSDATGNADIPLAFDFFDPNLLNPKGTIDPLTGHTSSDIGPILKAEADGVSQATDLMAVGDVRNLLFGNAGAGGDDLIARDVQRGRDNGITDYNSMRVALGLPAVTSFAQINPDPKIQQELAAAYPGGLNTIDAFEGGLAEAHVTGSDVGPLFQRIIADQFTRLRDGDRFFYLNEFFTPEEQSIMSAANTLTKVIEANTPVTNLQPNAFLFHTGISGMVRDVSATGSPAWCTVKLEDSSGNVLATTHTDRNGHYYFDQLSGPAANIEEGAGLSATGTYRVVLTVPYGAKTDASTSSDITLTHGDQLVGNVNFSLDWGTPWHRHRSPKRSG